ncbi:MAG: hypothetical protein ACLUFM_01125 [Lachnospiraceae bacterium]
MGKPTPLYDVRLLEPDGNEVPAGEIGEIAIRTADGTPCGLFTEYYLEPDKTAEVRHDGYYRCGDLAWKDEDGFFWYVSRADDVINPPATASTVRDRKRHNGASVCA